MNQNHILLVERLEKAKNLGWPHGTIELHREIPMLLARIKELENALVPFARVAQSEMTSKDGPSLVNVYLRDCVTALAMVDSANSKPIPRDNFFDTPA